MAAPLNLTGESNEAAQRDLLFPLTLSLRCLGLLASPSIVARAYISLL